MKLHWSPRSPFVRKVMVAAHELGLVDRITTVRSVVAATTPNAAVMADNPLSKIPTLVLDDGTILFDSLVICDYLNDLAGGSLIPRAGPDRWRVLNDHAILNGHLDFLLLWRAEREKPEERRTPELLAAFAAKQDAAMARLERAPPTGPVTIVPITLAILLSYLDFRHTHLEWRRHHPALAAWHADFAARPSMRATEIVDA